MNNVGTLYIVATPIGNLDDISQRALKILQEVDVVAAEDTRHSKKLLQSYQIDTPLISLHEHNESQKAGALLKRLEGGDSIALISDAGTPLISDPGYVLVRELREHGVAVVPVPGACAAIAALSAGGLPTDRFLFAGFLPHKAGPRRQALQALLQEQATVVLYESPRRIVDLLGMVLDMAPARQLCLAKEISKTFERFFYGTAAEIHEVITTDTDLQRGEWVVLLGAAPNEVAEEVSEEALSAVEVAAQALPLKKACELVATLTDYKKNQLYRAVLARREQ